MRSIAGKRGGTGTGQRKHPKPPRKTNDEQSNLSDPDSRLMRKSKQHEYRQAYNAQAVVDAGGSQLIVGARVTNCASDRMSWWRTSRRSRPFSAGPRRCWRTTAMPTATRSRRLPRAKEALVATGSSGRRRRYDFRPAKTEVGEETQGRMAQSHGRQARQRGRPCAYRLRQQTVEPVFGIIKAVLGFTGFSLRGLDKVAGEWDLVALAYNCKRLHKLKLEMAV